MSDTGAAVRLRELLAQVLDIPATAIGPETSAATVGSWTSLNHLMLISGIEETFGVVFSNQQIRDLTSYDKLLSAVTAQRTPGS